MKDIQQVFAGLYKEVNRETQQWYTVSEPILSPRPGEVGVLGFLSPSAHVEPVCLTMGPWAWGGSGWPWGGH